MSLATNVSNESGTGAVRSTDLAKERWDLVCYDSVQELAKAMSWFTDYALNPVQQISISLNYLGDFLSGSRGDTLARGWSYLAVAIQQLDMGNSEYEAWAVTNEHRIEKNMAGRFGSCLVPFHAIKRISTTCHEGAEKYGEHNWYNGFQVSGLLNHSAKHHLRWLNGGSEEDDLGHASWAYMASIYMMNHRPDMQKLLLGSRYSLTDEIKMYHAQLAAKREQLKVEAARLTEIKDEAFADHLLHLGPVS